MMVNKTHQINIHNLLYLKLESKTDIFLTSYRYEIYIISFCVSEKIHLKNYMQKQTIHIETEKKPKTGNV